MMRKVSGRKNPLFHDQSTLEFDNLSKEEVTELTIEQKLDKFMSRWIELMRPVSKYSRHIEESNKSLDRIFRDVKLYYKKFVIEGEWSEKKYVMVIDNIMKSSFGITEKNLKFNGNLFDQGRLEIQLAEKRLKGGRRI